MMPAYYDLDEYEGVGARCARCGSVAVAYRGLDYLCAPHAEDYDSCAIGELMDLVAALCG